ncbi:MAG TPA: cation diffusion facilitator family transporter [Candidatus Saccharimonadales bacterium]|nr:cation diffusion facilitator family transporter [Candidatus Saccharimonadales bacterium]
MSKECCDAKLINLKNKKNLRLKKVFWFVLLINFIMFLVEFWQGYISHSNALFADSLDMLGDAIVYGLSLYVIAMSQEVKARVSLLKGIIMGILGLLVAVEALSKIIYPVVPIGVTISIVGLLALAANAVSFWALVRYKNNDLNVKSAWICSRNDIMANLGVIMAGLLVIRFNSIWPDVTVGLIISFMIIYSSAQVVKESLGFNFHHN